MTPPPSSPPSPTTASAKTSPKPPPPSQKPTNAIFAINGDYYGFRDTGIVIRNGVIFRDEGLRQGPAFYRDGTVKVYDETTTSAEELLADGVWNTLSFGPSLVDNGEVAGGIEDVGVDTNFGNHSIQGEQPRTAVDIIDENHLVFVVVDGRSPGYSAGVTMTGLAEIMRGLGAATAYKVVSHERRYRFDSKIAGSCAAVTGTAWREGQAT